MKCLENIKVYFIMMIINVENFLLDRLLQTDAILFTEFINEQGTEKLKKKFSLLYDTLVAQDYECCKNGYTMDII